MASGSLPEWWYAHLPPWLAGCQPPLPSLAEGAYRIPVKAWELWGVLDWQEERPIRCLNHYNLFGAGYLSACRRCLTTVEVL
ncbi:hypothetical protein [Marinobacter sp. SS21]|uniref:hypothetical protein n=1 Tax=Marinobacter sp. SS21 TaxID=2979460 RepID=UPI0023304356|nr:hypothetical protein [Marinobacter sp. SS21]MDC0661246.1 hypothetical protein [Marinobacter sp. SS21]